VKVEYQRDEWRHSQRYTLAHSREYCGDQEHEEREERRRDRARLPRESRNVLTSANR
jgi:hypothetical protein